MLDSSTLPSELLKFLPEPVQDINLSIVDKLKEVSFVDCLDECIILFNQLSQYPADKKKLEKNLDGWLSDEGHKDRAALLIIRGILFASDQEFQMALEKLDEAQKLGLKNLDSTIALYRKKIQDKENAAITISSVSSSVDQATSESTALEDQSSSLSEKDFVDQEPSLTVDTGYNESELPSIRIHSSPAQGVLPPQGSQSKLTSAAAMQDVRKAEVQNKAQPQLYNPQKQNSSKCLDCPVL